ncbi:HlyD family secretion protein [Blastopirellula marina]|uniref:Probable multidrug resistance transmembrane protein n=1 Tax=Blastopirellula marina DSM 3645 TaxID=314230 RepID=A3ZY27_9BACT|nr:HlyD family secretion protein [Blastopirellula marina]EAQ78512.1 probable multidrug resistance transmembrane protein [Blastopirellula marina DSM 3645]
MEISEKPASEQEAAKQQTADEKRVVASMPKGEIPTSVPFWTRRSFWVRSVAIATALIVCAWLGGPWILRSLKTVSTDDAYVDGHVTFVAPRVSGQVLNVLVDDNVRVQKGDLLLQIDPEPYETDVALKEAQVRVAEANLSTAEAQVEGIVAQTRSNRFALEHAMESVRNQIAVLRSNVAQAKVEEASLVLAQRNFDRNRKLATDNVIAQSEFDVYTAQLAEAESRVDSAKEVVQQTRSALGLPINEANPLDMPADLDQNFSVVRETLANLMQSIAEIGYRPKSWDLTPNQAIDDFFHLNVSGDLDTIYKQLIADAPAIKQAAAALLQAQRQLDLAKLNLRYCNIVSDIDGVVTRRNVNPGNFVQSGESVLAVRSLTEIWVNANFKETQLNNLRIGQRVDLHVDMYGRERQFHGRISGFTMGTGQTLELLPPQNATGNFVKIVQRLPVRIDLLEYDPDEAPLFAGLSVTPYVFYQEPASGPNAGKLLQTPAELPVRKRESPHAETRTALCTGEVQ